MDKCICMAEPLCYSPKSTTTLLIVFIPRYNTKSLKFEKQEKKYSKLKKNTKCGMSFPVYASVKNLPVNANAGDIRNARLITDCVSKIPWRPGESHGQRSLVGYSP